MNDNIITIVSKCMVIALSLTGLYYTFNFSVIRKIYLTLTTLIGLIWLGCNYLRFESNGFIPPLLVLGMVIMFLVMGFQTLLKSERFFQEIYAIVVTGILGFGIGRSHLQIDLPSFLKWKFFFPTLIFLSGLILLLIFLILSRKGKLQKG